MKALVKKQSGEGLWLEDVPQPGVAANDVLIKVGRTGICGTDLGAALFDCSPDLLNPAAGARIIDYATTLVLEEHLHCRERDGDPWAAALERFADIAEIRQSGL